MNLNYEKAGKRASSKPFPRLIHFPPAFVRRAGRLTSLIAGLLLFLLPRLTFADASTLIAKHQNMARYYQEQHKPAPTLLELMEAATKGDNLAQNALADIYASHLDGPSALKWYRASAEQANTNAQLSLGKLLLGGYPASSVSAAVTPDFGEAVGWLGRAANQGSAEGQLLLAQCYQEGKGVNEDRIEEYKWLALAARQSNTTARAALENRTLKMRPEEVLTAQQWVDAFVPGKCANLPEPAYLGQLKLKGISGFGTNRLAVINNHTLAAHEEAQIKLDTISVSVRCLEVKDKSAIVQVGPFRKDLLLPD
jgi:TPR repeat protein